MSTILSDYYVLTDAKMELLSDGETSKDMDEAQKQVGTDKDKVTAVKKDDQNRADNKETKGGQVVADGEKRHIPSQQKKAKKRGRPLKASDGSAKKRQKYTTHEEEAPESGEKLHQEREKRQLRYQCRREEKIEKQREYYSRNRERMVEKQADYYKANRHEVIARQYEYYQKNKNRITEKKRQWYQEKRGYHMSTKKVVHPSMVESMPLQEPNSKVGSGILRIKHLNTIIERFNKEMNKKWKVTYDIQNGSDFLPNCGNGIDKWYPTTADRSNSAETAKANNFPVPGESKLDSCDYNNQNIMTLPEGYTYRCTPLNPSDLQDSEEVESFVGLSLSNDGESLDVRYLLHKDNLTLSGLKDVFHGVQSVCDIDMHDFLTEKQSLFFINPTCLSNPVLKNRYCKQVCKLQRGSTSSCSSPILKKMRNCATLLAHQFNSNIF